ncbi:MAG: hypothetical protein EHM21_17360 [Chloroflexi bacterium]|nr:MAG: hypothetical protein EHM21_17360 [Chloroflexota bacterium]
MSLAYSGFASFAAASSPAGSGLTASIPSVINSLVWIAFGAANVLVLTGTPHRTRNAIATGIFTVGFLAPLLFTGINAAAPVLFGDPQARFQDDFSLNRGWISRENGVFSSQIENSAYAVHNKENNSTFYAFPPLRFNPLYASLDAQAPEVFGGLVGTYGVACGYTEYEGSYLVEIDPAGNQYAFLKHDGKKYSSLTPMYWQPVTGTRLAPGTNRLEVGCADREITLSINGVEQGKVTVPGFSWHGKMGLFVRTWPESAQQGYKVLFDNVDFRRDIQP